MWLLSKFSPASTRTWNALLGSLAKVASTNVTTIVEPLYSNAALRFQVHETSMRYASKEITDLQRESGLMATVQLVLSMMSDSNVGRVTPMVPAADSQTFCVAATALQYSPSAGSTLATELFRNATNCGVTADGRFVNALLRCFGADIDAALALWKEEVRSQCISFEKRLRSFGRAGSRSLEASYNGLFYVSGRANRPDIALRLVYAMKRDGLEPTETSLNSYRSGQRRPHAKSLSETGGFGSSLERKLYESLISVECTKYDTNDRRRAGEQRVRIIL
jgi:pentatricopeptide repeat protein